LAEQSPLDSALDKAKSLIFTDSNGDQWVKVTDLQAAMSETHREQLPRIKSFAQAKALASMDEELVKSFPEGPLTLGPSATVNNPQPPRGR
jgi:hypothetical protein